MQGQLRLLIFGQTNIRLCVSGKRYSCSVVRESFEGVPSRRVLPQSKYNGNDPIRVRGKACVAVLGKTRGAGSHEDKLLEQVGGHSRGRAGTIIRSEGWDSMSKFQGAGWRVFIVLIVVVQGKCVGERTGLAGVVQVHRGTCTCCVEGVCMGKISGELASPEKVGRSSGHGSPYRGERVKIASGLFVKVVSTHINLLVIDPNVGEVDHGGYAQREGCLGRRAACILWRVGEVLVDWRTLSRHEAPLTKTKGKPT
ncbi:hypothetical protein CRG98_006374 [Punica granatum]|uniref:Uncharacterized protein n=1 Tax=Punica granatum TaxID=22663 RepID=A0A2I0KXN6_PUNGR|nr:hypothetical protein CRG98_006374 [Punica granatum]